MKRVCLLASVPLTFKTDQNLLVHNPDSFADIIICCVNVAAIFGYKLEYVVIKSLRGFEMPLLVFVVVFERAVDMEMDGVEEISPNDRKILRELDDAGDTRIITRTE